MFFYVCLCVNSSSLKQIIILIAFLLLFPLWNAMSQNDQVFMEMVLQPEEKTLLIHQKIIYYNRSSENLQTIYLHDWNHAFSDINSKLGKRFLEKYSNKFFFSSEKNRGFTDIHSILAKNESVRWIRETQSIDQIQVLLNKPILPKEFLTLEIDYKVKLPHSKFTGYGFENKNFNLKYFYIIPAVYEDAWQLMSHLDMDDLYQNPTDYSVNITLPDKYNVFSNLHIEQEEKGKYSLKGNSIMNFELEFTLENSYQNFQTDSLVVSTNLNSIELGHEIKNDLLNRQLIFLRENLGSFPQKKLMINQTSYNENPLYGFNQLPNFLRPFSDTFECDMRMFQTLSKTYIDQSIFTNTRKNAWLREGLPHYLMMKYVKEYYPEKKLIGNISKIWGVKSYYLSKMNFNDRYLYGYQFISRYDQDQALSVATDSLTNYNRLIANRFKTALSLNYLDDYLGKELVKNGIKDYFAHHVGNNSNRDVFKESIENSTKKDMGWFFNTYLFSDKNLDFKINNLIKTQDSIKISLTGGIKNMPVSVYGLDHSKIISKYWFVPTKPLTYLVVPNQQEKKWMLNYEGIIPEIDLKNNLKNTESKIYNKPIKIRWMSDAEDPYHTQLFIEPNLVYNYYDGFLIASAIHNHSLFKKPFEFSVIPSFGIKSNDLTGSYGLRYVKYVENKTLSSFRLGIGGNYFHYKPTLAYKTLSLYTQFVFKDKNFRSVKGKSLSFNYTFINKETDPSILSSMESDKYSVFLMNYYYSNPTLINNFLLNTNLEVGTNFSKLFAEIKFRKLTDSNSAFEARFFTGIFLYNRTTSDYFSYGVNRPYDYLFRYRYFGRSETKGIYSQQFIMNDGGFKADMPVKFANQWMTSINLSIGLWKWFEVYNDVGFVKNKAESVFFVHDKGIRFNMSNNFLELYFPMHSNNGWEIAQPHYEEKIRFVFTANFKSIITLIKRKVL